MSEPYNVYVGATPTIQTLSKGSTVAEVRKTLTTAGRMKDTDVFLYQNPVTQLKTVLAPRSAEDTAKLQSIAFPAVQAAGNNHQLIQIVSVARESPSLLGTTPAEGWFRPNAQMSVRIGLNTRDPSAISNNRGLFNPVLLENVQSADPNNPVSFRNCCIVQKGTIISFDTGSWGAAGFGYTITAAANMGANICDGMYISYDGSPRTPYDRSTTTSLNRYVGSPNTIQIESNASMRIATQLNIAYSTITVNTFSLSSWEKKDGTKYQSSTPIPSGPSNENTSGMLLQSNSSVSNWTPPPPAGQSSVPGGAVIPASPKAGPPSEEKFSSVYAPTPLKCPATRAEGLVGSIQIYFLVFTSKEAANAVIKVLNSGTMQM